MSSQTYQSPVPRSGGVRTAPQIDWENYDQWAQSLKGEHGLEIQRVALQRLSNYVYVVAYNCIRRKCLDVPRLSYFNQRDMAMLAEDFVQDFIVKLLKDDCELLSKYSGRGRFTAWAAQVMVNMILSAFRKVEWSRCDPLEEQALYVDSDAVDPVQSAQRNQIRRKIAACLDQLPPQYRTVLVRCIIQGEPASAVAQDLSRNVQAVYNLAHRAKKQLVTLLARENVGPEDLAAFCG